MKNGLLKNIDYDFQLNTKEKKKNWKIGSHEFLHFLQNQYPFLRSSLKYNFEMHINSTNLLQPPKFSKSNILNEENIRMLILFNSKFHTQLEMNLLFSSKVHGNSFNKLIDKIVGWSAPALFLIKSSYKNIDKENVECVIGAMTFCQLLDHQFYYGDSSIFLFSLFPTLKKISVKQGKRKNNFLYINSTTNKHK